MPYKEALIIVVEKITSMDGLCLLPHPRLRVKSTTIKCIHPNVLVPACPWDHSLQKLQEIKVPLLFSWQYLVHGLISLQRLGWV